MSDLPRKSTAEELWDAAQASVSDLERLLEQHTWSAAELSKALWLAAEWCHPKSVESLLRHGAHDPYRHALNLSLKSIDTMKLLLAAHKTDAREVNNTKRPLLHRVLERDSKWLPVFEGLVWSMTLLLGSSFDDAKSYLASCHPPKQLVKFRPTLLDHALGPGSEEVLSYFIENGVDPNLRYRGLTPLHIGAFHGWVVGAKTLIRAGARTDTEATITSFRALVGETPAKVVWRQIRVQGAAKMDVTPWEEIDAILRESN